MLGINSVLILKSLKLRIENLFLSTDGQRKVKQIVLDIIAEIAPDEDLNDVKSDIRLRDQLDLDSMDFLDIVMELRKQHGIDVPKLSTVSLSLLIVVLITCFLSLKQVQLPN